MSGKAPKCLASEPPTLRVHCGSAEEAREDAYAQVTDSCTNEKKRVRWLTKVEGFKPLIKRVIDQTQRRVFGGEDVAAKEKLFSIFEDHTDIIIKGDREINYGHKLNLTSGKSGLILDVVIEQGNPSDTSMLIFEISPIVIPFYGGCLCFLFVFLCAGTMGIVGALH